MHGRHQMLEQARRIILIKLGHVLRLDNLLFLLLVGLLVHLEEACILRQLLSLEIELQVDVCAVVLADQVIQV